MIRNFSVLMLVIMGSICCYGQSKSEASVYAGNPVFKGWYADPEGIIFDDEYWIYPTYSDHYKEPDTSLYFTDKQVSLKKNTINPQYLIQTFFNAFSSPDLVNWTKHGHVLDVKDVDWTKGVGGHGMWVTFGGGGKGGG